VEDTFIITAGRLDRLRDPRKLRPWLYAVARNECHSRLRTSEVGLGEDAGLPDPPSATDVRGRAEQAELARLVRTALDELSPGEREAMELDLRHDLQGADLAAVLGVPRNQAQALASHARDELEAALGPLFVARTGRRGCAELDLLLDGWDGQLTGSTCKLVSRISSSAPPVTTAATARCGRPCATAWPRWPHSRPGCATRYWNCALTPARRRCRTGGT
jgi:RNA polymerase sigma factor (sigma-70 family)